MDVDEYTEVDVSEPEERFRRITEVDVREAEERFTEVDVDEYVAGASLKQTRASLPLKDPEKVSETPSPKGQILQILEPPSFVFWKNQNLALAGLRSFLLLTSTAASSRYEDNRDSSAWQQQA